MYIITGLLWVFFATGFIDVSAKAGWGSDANACLTALLYFIPAYGFYFLGFRLYVSKIVTIGCTIMAGINLVVLAGTVHWLLCIPAAPVALALVIGLSVLVWKTDL